MKYRWDPIRGATLKTIFVGQCKLQFPITGNPNRTIAHLTGVRLPTVKTGLYYVKKQRRDIT